MLNNRTQWKMILFLGLTLTLVSCSQSEKSVSDSEQRQETGTSVKESHSSESTNESSEESKVSEQIEQSNVSISMDETGIERGDYSSVIGYWESESGEVWELTENGLSKENPGFKGLQMNEVRKLEDIHETELTRLRAEDGHLMDVVTTSRGSRVIMHKYVPKGTLYSPKMVPDDSSNYLTAEEDMIMTAMNGTDGAYHIYRRSEHGEVRAIIDTHTSGAGILFSVPNKIVLAASSEPINIHQFDMGDVIDYYNTHRKEAFTLEMVLSDLGTVQKRDGRASDISTQELEELKKNWTEMQWFYFEADHQLLLVQSVTGHVGPSLLTAPVSEWLFEDDTIKVPLHNSDGTPFGEIILKQNNKHYEGGRKKSTYYVYEYRIGN